MQLTENNLLELDPESLVITSMIPLTEITHLIRCFDEPQMFLIEFARRAATAAATATRCWARCWTSAACRASTRR